jgi:hypothetical protein
MFLSKRDGFYHLFYEDAAGKGHSRSTGCTIKADAMKFLQKELAQDDNRSHLQFNGAFRSSH